MPAHILTKIGGQVEEIETSWTLPSFHIENHSTHASESIYTKPLPIIGERFLNIDPKDPIHCSKLPIIVQDSLPPNGRKINQSHNKVINKLNRNLIETTLQRIVNPLSDNEIFFRRLHIGHIKDNHTEM